MRDVLANHLLSLTVVSVVNVVSYLLFVIVLRCSPRVLSSSPDLKQRNSLDSRSPYSSFLPRASQGRDRSWLLTN